MIDAFDPLTTISIFHDVENMLSAAAPVKEVWVVFGLGNGAMARACVDAEFLGSLEHAVEWMEWLRITSVEQVPDPGSGTNRGFVILRGAS